MTPRLILIRAPRRLPQPGGNGIGFPPPAIPRFENGAGGGDGRKGGQGLAQDRRLLVDVSGFPQGVAEGPAQEHGPRWFDLLCVFAHDGDAHGGDAGMFDDALDQSYGLIADPSGRGQQNRIHGVFVQQGGNPGGGLTDQRPDMAAVDVPHEAVVAFGQGADAAGRPHLLQAGQG